MHAAFTPAVEHNCTPKTLTAALRSKLGDSVQPNEKLVLALHSGIYDNWRWLRQDDMRMSDTMLINSSSHKDTYYAFRCAAEAGCGYKCYSLRLLCLHCVTRLAGCSAQRVLHSGGCRSLRAAQVKAGPRQCRHFVPPHAQVCCGCQLQLVRCCSI